LYGLNRSSPNLGAASVIELRDKTCERSWAVGVPPSLMGLRPLFMGGYRKKAFTRLNVGVLTLAFPTFKTIRNEFLLFVNDPVSNILL
jgi:hypothetical protein